MADNLESFFKKKLSDETPGEDQWNMPSDEVWENARPRFQRKRGLFIQRKYLIAIALIALIGMAAFVFVWNQDAPEIISAEDLVVHESDADPTNNKTELATEFVASESITIIDEEKKNSLDEMKPPAAEEPNENQPENTKDKQQAPSVKAIAMNSSNLDKEIDILNSDAEIADQSALNKEALIIDSIKTDDVIYQSITKDSLIHYAEESAKRTHPDSAFLADSNTNNTEIDQVDEPFVLKNITFEDQGKFAFGLYFAPTLTNTYLRGDMVSGMSKTSPVYLYSSDYGLEVKYHISNKLALVTGIGKSEIRSWSKSDVDFTYDLSTEQILENGEKENTSPIPMSTPFGQINTEVTYRFAGSDQIADGELMQSEMETHQKILYSSIPLGVEYKMMNKNRWAWLAEGGMAFNRSVRDGSEFSSKIIHTGMEMEVTQEKAMSDPDFKQIYLSYYAGTGLSYRISKSFQLSSSLRYFGNINKVNLQDHMTTNVRGFNFKIGVYFIF